MNYTFLEKLLESCLGVPESLLLIFTELGFLLSFSWKNSGRSEHAHASYPVSTPCSLSPRSVFLPRFNPINRFVPFFRNKLHELFQDSD